MAKIPAKTQHADLRNGPELQIAERLGHWVDRRIIDEQHARANAVTLQLRVERRQQQPHGRPVVVDRGEDYQIARP
ncbi:hypothetical protein D3C83_81640 [compost metagenome]